MPDDNVNENNQELQNAPETAKKPEEEKENPEEEAPRPPSKIYKAISRIFFLFLLLSLGVATFLSVLTLDFLDIVQFRYNVPQEWRSKWPLAPYYDFVQLHQLPEEERYQQLMIRQQQRFEREIVQGNKELEQRADELEKSYRALIKTQKERYNRQMENLRQEQEQLVLDQKQIEAEKADLAKRKKSIDELSNKLASEAVNIESSLIRFMEDEQRLEQVRKIAAVMDAGALANIFNEVPENQLIYDIVSGLPPAHAGKVLSMMDTEKAGQILELGQEPLTLPEPGPSRSYIPPGLTNLIASTQANLRN
jgi:flagellar motility protein MotE (MotC chaperone)